MTKQRMYCCIFYTYSMLFLLLLWHNNMHPTPVQPIQSARGKHVSHDVQHRQLEWVAQCQWYSSSSVWNWSWTCDLLPFWTFTHRCWGDSSSRYWTWRHLVSAGGQVRCCCVRPQESSFLKKRTSLRLQWKNKKITSTAWTENQLIKLHCDGCVTKHVHMTCSVCNISEMTRRELVCQIYQHIDIFLSAIWNEAISAISI